jgi:hypothetical protein
MDAFLAAFNNSKIAWGISMLVVNLGSRYVIMDLGQNHERILNSPLVKPMIVFSIVFMATRDFWVSLVMTLAFLVVFIGLLHEKSRFCCVPPPKTTPPAAAAPAAAEAIPAPTLYAAAKRVVEAFENAAPPPRPRVAPRPGAAAR